MVRGKKYLKNHPIREPEENLVCLVIFNTGNMNLRKARDELSKILSNEANNSIMALKVIGHKQRLPRIDMWVKSELRNTLKRTIKKKTKRRTPYMLKLLREQGLITLLAWGVVLSR